MDQIKTIGEAAISKHTSWWATRLTSKKRENWIAQAVSVTVTSLRRSKSERRTTYWLGTRAINSVRPGVHYPPILCIDETRHASWDTSMDEGIGQRSPYLLLQLGHANPHSVLRQEMIPRSHRNVTFFRRTYLLDSRENFIQCSYELQLITCTWEYLRFQKFHRNVILNDCNYVVLIINFDLSTDYN